MRTLVISLVGVSVFASAGAAKAPHEPSAATAERVTILARPTTLGRGQPMTLYGSVDSQSAEEIVTIEAKDCGQTSFREVASARTQAGGGWSTGFNPGITTNLRAVWNGVTSSPITVRAAPGCSSKEGRRRRFCR